VAKLSYEAATEENAKRRSFMPRTQVTGKANLPGSAGKINNMIFYEVQNRRISVGNVPHDKQSRKPWSACPDCSEDLNEDIKTQPPYVKCPFCGAPIQPIWWQQTIYALLGLFLSVAFPASLEFGVSV